MTKYLKIPPDPDASPCHCGDGDPDCDHWESCDGCGMDYRKHEGHDCIDGVPVQDLRALAKELRDSMASCETERDRLRTQARELTDAELDAIYPEGRSLGTYHHEIHRLLLRRVIAAGIKKSLIAGSARLVPTPHQHIQPEERRVGADEVVVSREEWEVIEQILKASAICANEGGTDRHCCMQTDDHHIPLTRIRAIRALRTSAQAHNGEESK